MFIFIILFVFFIMTISLYATYMDGTKPKGNIVLGVTLPYQNLKDDAVKKILMEYKRDINILSGILFSSSFITLLFQNYPSLIIIYMFVWFTLFFYLGNSIYMKNFRKLYKLKKVNGWFFGSTHIITIDTEVSRLKDKMPVSKLYFIPTFIISLMPFIIALFLKVEFKFYYIFYFLISVLTHLLLLYLYNLFTSKKSDVFSEDTKVNLYCNYVYKRYYSICYILLAFIESLCLMFIFLNILKIYINPIVLTAVVVVSTLFSTALIIYTQNKIKNMQNRILSISDNPLIVDNDEYWERGYYYNPNDSNLMVEKRIGYGLTINMAHRWGKIITFLTFSFIAAVIIPLSIMFIKFDTANFSMKITGDDVKISAPVYGYSFRISEIEKVEIIDKMPSKFKTNGVATSIYCLGNFNVEGYGPSKLFIYNKVPPFIAIKLKDRFVFLNSKDKDITLKYYRELIDKARTIKLQENS
ncbi:Uncharacterized membrane protein [Caloramator quimbayensis]|uniref:Uncharacterized membrane protein n=1 Tax=Caloramator quimbayensis TaxID=1147123 RepID=A0A1T4WLW9_9CLOT|nr:DUF5808 domain-containing protein [Caloramator quimbayensis]SKA78333.1 Uncharacterized membrane protein [Caloramator quimbayensis]